MQSSTLVLKHIQSVASVVASPSEQTDIESFCEENHYGRWFQYLYTVITMVTWMTVVICLATARKSKHSVIIYFLYILLH